MATAATINSAAIMERRQRQWRKSILHLTVVPSAEPQRSKCHSRMRLDLSLEQAERGLQAATYAHRARVPRRATTSRYVPRRSSG
jgi:hypothetical protein